MKASKDISQLIAEAREDELRDIVSRWAEEHQNFRDYVEKCLCPSPEDVDFRTELSLAVSRETIEFFSRHDVREVTDWSRVFYELIEPWSESAPSLPTERLFDLCEAIATEAAMQVTEEDFYGDDWHGDDFSGYIQDIMDVLADIAGLILTREDVSDETLDSLKSLILTAKSKDVIDGYIGAPYNLILELTELRQNAGEVVCGIYDAMIGAKPRHRAGAWVCRKIDFIRSMGLEDEARKYMEEEVGYPEVCLKYYHELIVTGDWQNAIRLLDKAQTLKENGNSHYFPGTPDWLALKQELLEEHGSPEDRIENLKQRFYKSYDKAEYYRKLKELVGADDWKTFYPTLLSGVKGYGATDDIAPFLIEEGEYDWLYRLVTQAEKKDPTDYRTPLRYADALRQTHFREMETRLVRNIRAYAADRFPPKKQVKSSKYAYFRADLESLSELGYPAIQKGLVEYLTATYCFRPALVKELQSIKFSNQA